MSEIMAELATLHPGRDLFPKGIFEVLADLNQEPGLLAFAWELSRIPQGLDRAQRQDLLLLALALLVTQGQGHTRMALVPEPGSPAHTLLARLDRADLDLPALAGLMESAALVGNVGAARPFIREGGWLYSQRLHNTELELERRIRELIQRDAVSAALPQDILRAPVPLNDEQAAAVQLALEHPLALVTGGPGTGKTSIVVAILRGLLYQPDMDLGDLALAAPTGKAAQRMGEAIRRALGSLADPGEVDLRILAAFPEPRTLHRLLAWHPAAGRFRHDEANPLSARVVIVDEASMISLEHMDHLLRALAPGARLVLLGDADQLPSVEAGRAFRDLVEGLASSCVRLRTSYRMREADPEGRNILSVARVIHEPTSGDLWRGPEPIRPRTRVEELEGRGVELLAPEPGVLEAFFRRWFSETVLGLGGFAEKAGRVFVHREEGWSPEDAAVLRELSDHFDRFRILGALREAGELRGVTEVNALLHGWMAAHMGEGLRHSVPFFAGEPVLMTANDHRRGIYNGDHGLVLKVRFEDGVRQAAVFPRIGGFRAFPLDALRTQLELCYAMTVHKSQGSEYERIALVLPRTDHKALTKELLYTALTRARKSVVLLAEPERIAFALGNPTRRDSGLADRLAVGA